MTTTPLAEATYVLSIVADSGHESTTEGRCNLQQYSAAMRALNNAAWAHEITQARADLEAENQRLREALQIAHDHIDMNALRVSHGKDAATITAALEKQP